MAKILVADDNSNVQKTMALALADLGVEVISVNNGEAAVRKLAEVSPDLVLADIFMPVRNGYEVCEYVKKDSRFSHVPVILLVGAFDPLDEREAQRVGADGILKKPFVPPDPLIAMVKTLLDRSMSERLVAVSVSKAAEAVQVKASSRTVPETQLPSSPLPEEQTPEVTPASAGRVTFGEGERPVAFGQLLDPPVRSAASGTSVIEPLDDEQVLTSSRDTNLGEPAFWRNDPPEIEVQPESEHSADNKDELSLRKWGLEDDSSPRREDAAIPQPVEADEPLEFIRDEEESVLSSRIDSGPVELDPAAQSALTVESGKAPELAANPLEWLATAPAQPPGITPETTLGWDGHDSGEIQLEPEPEPAPFPGRFKEEAPLFSLSDVPEIEPASVSGGLSFGTQGRKVDPAPASGGLKVEPAPVSGGLKLDPAPVSGGLPFGTQNKQVELAPISGGLPFGAQGKKVDPAPSTETPKPRSILEPPKHPEFAVQPDIRNTNDATAKISEQTPSAVPHAQPPEDTARSVPMRKWSEMTDSLEERASEIVARHLVPVSVPSDQNPTVAQLSSPVAAPKPLQPSDTNAFPNPAGSIATVAPASAAAPVNTAKSAIAAIPSSTLAVPDPALVEAVVQRVLDKMRPQVVDIITREFLRPVVQALVHREIEKK